MEGLLDVFASFIETHVPDLEDAGSLFGDDGSCEDIAEDLVEVAVVDVPRIRSSHYPTYLQHTVTEEVPYETSVLTNLFTDAECVELTKDDVLSAVTECEEIEHSEFSIGPKIYTSRLSLLDDLFLISEHAGKENLRLYGLEPFADMNFTTEEFLRYSRYLRKCYSLQNAATKVAFCRGPMCTRYKFELCETIPSSSAVLFGFAHNKHHGFRSVNGVRLAVDTDVEKSSGRVVKGSIVDWRKFVLPSDDLIVSDVSVGRKKEMGFFGHKELLQVYRDMYEAGYELVYKSDIFSPPVGDLVGYFKQRPHNVEVIYHVRRGGGMEPPEFEIDIGNAERNDVILEDRCPPYVGEVFPSRSSLFKTLDCSAPYAGCKDLDRFLKLNPAVGLGYDVICLREGLLDEVPECTPFDPGIEPPFAFIDLDCTGVDPFSYFYGIVLFFGKEFVKYDSGVGYYVE